MLLGEVSAAKCEVSAAQVSGPETDTDPFACWSATGHLTQSRKLGRARNVHRDRRWQKQGRTKTGMRKTLVDRMGLEPTTSALRTLKERRDNRLTRQEKQRRGVQDVAD